jgi:hypothetical protein
MKEAACRDEAASKAGKRYSDSSIVRCGKNS